MGFGAAGMSREISSSVWSWQGLASPREREKKSGVPNEQAFMIHICIWPTLRLSLAKVMG